MLGARLWVERLVPAALDWWRFPMHVLHQRCFKHPSTCAPERSPAGPLFACESHLVGPSLQVR